MGHGNPPDVDSSDEEDHTDSRTQDMPVVPQPVIGRYSTLQPVHARWCCANRALCAVYRGMTDLENEVLPGDSEPPTPRGGVGADSRDDLL